MESEVCPVSHHLMRPSCTPGSKRDRGQQETMRAFSFHLSLVNKNKALKNETCWV